MRFAYLFGSGRQPVAAALGMGMALALSGGACVPPKVEDPAQSSVESEGSDNQKRYEAGPALGDPPPMDANAIGADYLGAIEALLQPAWSSFLEDCRSRLPGTHVLNQPSLTALTEISLTPKGELLGARVLESSGNPEFDGVALEILRDTAIFPEPAADWMSDDDKFHLQWRFSRDQRQAGAATARIEIIEAPLEKALPRLIGAHQFDIALRRLDARAAGLGERLLEFAKMVAAAETKLALASEDPTVKLAALKLSAHLPVPGRILALSAELASTNMTHRLVAIESLQRIGSPEAIEHLQRVVAGEILVEPGVLASAAEALVALGKGQAALERARKELSSADDAKRWRALAVLSKVEDEASASPLSKRMAQAKSREERAAAVMALGTQARVSNTARKALTKGLESKDATIRAACAQAIAATAKAGVKNRIAYWKLVDMLGDKDERVRAASLVAAARLEPARFAKELPRIKAKGSREVILAFAEILPIVPGPEAEARLGDLLAAPDRELRLAAARSLIELPEGKGLPLLRKLIGDSDEQIQDLVVRHTATEAELEALLEASTARIQQAALHKLAATRGAASMSPIALKRILATDEAPTRLDWYRAWLTQ